MFLISLLLWISSPQALAAPASVFPPLPHDLSLLKTNTLESRRPPWPRQPLPRLKNWKQGPTGSRRSSGWRPENRGLVRGESSAHYCGGADTQIQRASLEQTQGLQMSLTATAAWPAPPQTTQHDQNVWFRGATGTALSQAINGKLLHPWKCTTREPHTLFLLLLLSAAQTPSWHSTHLYSSHKP